MRWPGENETREAGRSAGAVALLVIACVSVDNGFHLINMKNINNSKETKMARPLKLIPEATVVNIGQQIGDIADRFANHPDVKKFSISVDNRSGLVSANIVHNDGRTQTTELITKGLSQTTNFDPRNLDIEDRDNAVISLLSQGLTQTETARRIGISQSRVAQIKKANQQ